MRKISITDITLRLSSETGSLNFKEKVEVAKCLDRLNVSAMELAPLGGGKTDVIFVKTLAGVIKNATIAQPVGLTEESVEAAWDALKEAARPRLVVDVPVSSVQMEFIARKKPAAMLETIEALVKKAVSLCGDVEFCAADASRAEKEFLVKAIETAIAAGATSLTVCDTAGVMLPDEFGAFVKGLYDEIPGMKDIFVKVRCDDALELAGASAVAAMGAGASGVKTCLDGVGAPKLKAMCEIIAHRGESIGVTSTVKTTELTRTVTQMGRITGAAPALSAPEAEHSDVTYSKEDSITAIIGAVKSLGYDLSDEDNTAVYEEFLRHAAKKAVGIKEIDAMVAAVALQVPAAYKLDSYVINSGNIITATANLRIDCDGEKKDGFSAGDGPIDAAFKAIEMVSGNHYELEDFRIDAVTEGGEAIGRAIVKLRAGGKLYPSSGISTDIVEAAIRAYIGALNKIVYEERE